MTGEGADPLARLDILDSAPEAAFDDIATLAGQICGTPTALVTLLDGDRQWFKARTGFACEQTGIDRSVCRHVVAAAETLVIPDLTLDPRTAANPMVVGEPHMRFYAGAPLNTRFGPVGALCVIDAVPRPAGLTDLQRSQLEMLARQVVTLLEARRDALELADAVEARDSSAAGERLNERRWRELYQGMDQGFVYARAVRDDDGVIHDWRHEDVNRAWGELVGRASDSAFGRTVRELIPGIEDGWVADLARVVDDREPVRYTKRVGALDRWFEGVAQWVGGDDFTIIFQDVTARISGERRRDALLALGDMLRDEDDVTTMRSNASEIIGEALGAMRVSFGDVDGTREAVDFPVGWARPGVAELVGTYRFDAYGNYINRFLAGETIVVDDVRADPRTADELPAWEALGVRAVVNAPVVENRRVVGMMIVHHDDPHAWTSDELAFVRSATDRLEIAIAQRRSEVQQEILNGEIAHRLKNTLAMVQGVAMQTLRGDASSEGLDAFARRLQALGAAHDALTSGRSEAAPLRQVVERVLDAAGVLDRCRLDGPVMPMGPRAALAGSLLVHELATNAVKHGSLSVEGGHVDVRWRIEGDPKTAEVILDWIELGGPPAASPSRRGFGSKLIRLGLVGTGGSAMRYEHTGFIAEFRATLEQVEQA